METSYSSRGQSPSELVVQMPSEQPTVAQSLARLRENYDNLKKEREISKKKEDETFLPPLLKKSLLATCFGGENSTISDIKKEATKIKNEIKRDDKNFKNVLKALQNFDPKKTITFIPAFSEKEVDLTKNHYFDVNKAYSKNLRFIYSAALAISSLAAGGDKNKKSSDEKEILSCAREGGFEKLLEALEKGLELGLAFQSRQASTAAVNENPSTGSDSRPVSDAIKAVASPETQEVKNTTKELPEKSSSLEIKSHYEDPNIDIKQLQRANSLNDLPQIPLTQAPPSSPVSGFGASSSGDNLVEKTDHGGIKEVKRSQSLSDSQTSAQRVSSAPPRSRSS